MPKQKDENLKKYNIYLHIPTVEAIKWLAQRRGTSYSNLLREALKDFAVKEVRKEQEDIQVLGAINTES